MGSDLARAQTNVFEAGFVQPGDITDCLSPPPPGPATKPSCARIIWTFKLWPQIEKLLKSRLKSPPVIIVPIGPDPGPLTDRFAPSYSFLIQRDIFGAMMNDPSPQPSVGGFKMPMEVVLKETIRLRDGMHAVAKDLDGEVKRLQSLKKK
jgi:hypothetical protein